MNLQNNVVLDNLNDQQKLWLSQISYLNINDEGRKKIENGGISVVELKNYLSNPNTPFVGDALVGAKNFNFVTDQLIGKDAMPSQSQVVDYLIQSGLGELKIVNLSAKEKSISSGFQAMSFVDSAGNVGISYRGSDFDFSNGGIKDWIEADILEYFKNDSKQRVDALEYFESNKSTYGKNYVYGHSLGGNLTSHVYSENYNEIEEAFTINGNPINQKLLDTPEKIAAFNDPKKYNCNIVCGDIVGHFKSSKSYENNVKYIQNNDSMNNNIVAAHMIQSAELDENGNFKYATKSEMQQKMGWFKESIMNFTKFVREAMNEISIKFENAGSNYKAAFDQYKNDFNNSFDNKLKEFKIEENDMNFSNENEKELVSKFQNMSKQAEQEQISAIMYQLEQSKINNQSEEELENSHYIR